MDITSMAEALTGQPQNGVTCQPVSSADALQMQLDAMNRERRESRLYDCPECLNREVIHAVRDGRIVTRWCKCHTIRENLRRIRHSGLSDLLDLYTFENYRVESEWQQEIKRAAMAFLDDHYWKWWYIGGQVGAGKTHICTAIAGEFLRRDMDVRYMLWRDVSTQLKACVTDSVEYNRLIMPIKEAAVLYIDDFFKTERGKTPSTADINLAFEILNYRYNDRNLVTIISSEWDIGRMLDVDEAVGSRIYQRSKEYNFVIQQNPASNYRMGGLHG